MNYLISRELLKAVGEYLSTRPYREVAPMLEQLMQLAPAPEPQEQPKEPNT